METLSLWIRSTSGTQTSVQRISFYHSTDFSLCGRECKGSHCRQPSHGLACTAHIWSYGRETQHYISVIFLSWSETYPSYIASNISSHTDIRVVPALEFLALGHSFSRRNVVDLKPFPWATVPSRSLFTWNAYSFWPTPQIVTDETSARGCRDLIRWTAHTCKWITYIRSSEALLVHGLIIIWKFI